MDLRGRTFWEMEKESISYVRKNESVWVQQAAIAAVVTVLEGNERELDLAYKAQDANDPGGHIAQKNQAIASFIHKIFKLGRKLSFYAKRQNDQVLLKDVGYSESALLKLSEKEALIKCNTIINRGKEYLSKTADYGVTSTDLDALTAELSTLEKLQPTIGVITNDRKSAGRSIKDLISEAHDLLDQLDDAFDGLVDDDNFLVGWSAVRKIKGRHKVAAKVANGTSSVNDQQPS